jgi:hypothetical protein
MKLNTVVSLLSFYQARKKTLSLFTALILLAITSCKDDGPESPQSTGCRLVMLTNTVSGRYDDKVTYTYISKLGHTYDAQGNETASTVSYDYTYSDGTTATSAGNTSKQYDDQGFLLRSVNQNNSTDRDKSTAFSTYSSEHNYENGRLVKTTSETTSNGGPKQTNIYLYEYNSDGNLTKFTNVSSNLVTTIEYSGKKITKVTQVNAKGEATSPFFEYNNAGLLVKWIESSGGYTEEYRYQYDAVGQVTRRERYINGKANSADETEYDTKQSPYQTLTANPKGHPNIPSLYADYVSKNNPARSTYYDGNAAGTGWVTRGSSIYTYDYNATGFPLSATAKSFDALGVETNNTSSVYEYEACN